MQNKLLNWSERKSESGIASRWVHMESQFTVYIEKRQKSKKTRMHSSRMRTDRLVAISEGGDCPGVYTEWLIDRCKNIALSKWAVKKRTSKTERCLNCYFQNETALCKRFTTFVTKYNLMSKDNLIVPILETSKNQAKVKLRVQIQWI